MLFREINFTLKCFNKMYVNKIAFLQKILCLNSYLIQKHQTLKGNFYLHAPKNII